MNRTKKALCAALLPAVILVAGCSPEAVPGPAPAPPSPSVASSVQPTAPSGAPSSAEPQPNDLQKGPLRRTYQSSGLTITVEYSAVPAVERWTPNGTKSIRLLMTVANKRDPKRKIYLSRATLQFGLRDANGDIPGPDPVVDTSGLNPGYLVTSPYSYNQSFLVPPLDDSAVALTLEFKFETVTLVDPKAKDYTKQSSTDAVQVALTF